MSAHAKPKPILWVCAVCSSRGALQNKPAPFDWIRRQKSLLTRRHWREFRICASESMQLKAPFYFLFSSPFAWSSSPPQLKVGTSAKLLFPQSAPFTSILSSLTTCLPTSRPSVHKTNHFWASADNVGRWCKSVYHFASSTLKVLLCFTLWRHVIEQRMCVCVQAGLSEGKPQKPRGLIKQEHVSVFALTGHSWIFRKHQLCRHGFSSL